MAKRTVPVNIYPLREEDTKYLPAYLRNTGETPEEVQCTTNGVWPAWLSGSFIRCGTGRFTVPLSEDGSKPNAVLQHFLDGLSILHKFRLDAGKVYYMSKHTSNGVVQRAKEKGYVETLSFGLNPNTPLLDAQDPCYTLYGKHQSVYLPEGYQHPDAVSVSVNVRRAYAMPPSLNPHDRGSPADIPSKDEITVLTDFNIIQVCDRKTLEPKRLLNYGEIDEELNGMGICAHPVKDRGRGEIYNYLISNEGRLWIFAMNYTTIPAKMVWKTVLPCSPCYIHSLAMTQRYVVFVRNPISMDTSDLTKPFTDMMVVEEDSPTSFFVLDKQDGKLLAQYDAPHFMFFHTTNAYDFPTNNGDTSIHVDICSFDKGPIHFREYHLSNFVDPGGPFSNATLVRYELAELNAHASTLSGRPGRVTVACAIAGTGFELPHVAKSASMNPSYRYAYGTGNMGDVVPGSLVPMGRLSNGLKLKQAAYLSSVVKADWATGTFKQWKPDNGETCPCEPVFIARPGTNRDEDDGIVLTIVCNREGTHSVLIALDARTLTEVARAEMPQVYGLGPHGTFIEDY